MITVHDLETRLAILNIMIGTHFYLEHYAGQLNPYRIMSEDQGSILLSGTRSELYLYLTGAIEGINSYKAAHNIR